ncbi:Gas vesicle protein [Flavobacterium sp. 9AF]|uniref:YtxH domain-containing protein n=1 Tax=Flavobacterium sp. 9AF TaxID=2653142 RepID=UPI0012F2A08B|nr:YtxH domain-containing protein [Flavobacterium sp. 9AF]VXC06626.1 Gas vesicle protein [Flavobacterium sp. 9AF]
MKTNNAILGVMAGLAAGAVLGVLFAPDKGSNTRKKIGKKANDLKDNLKQGYDSTVSAIEKKYTELQDKYDFLSENIDDKINEGKSKIKEELAKI